ncbi:3351_t:CDS:2 [Entrophospora sp. SA101]|nr:3351_t:CDS:2 [Entrophospora sp. SA101]CAJ0885267.1 349_t:CDS:2 [Entrophospora sp. SA101]
MNHQSNVPSNEQSSAHTVPGETYSGDYRIHQNLNIPTNTININNIPEQDPNGDRNDKRLFFMAVVEILTVATITAATTTELLN